MYLIILAAIGAIVLLPALLMGQSADFLQAAAAFVIEHEGFLAHPKWDNKQYTWGYGTQAPGATGTISQDQAYTDMVAYLQDVYNTLSPLLTVQLSGNQWVALLDFAFNEGPAAAQRLIPDINSGDASVVIAHMKLYNIEGGQISSNLIARRNDESDMWIA